MLTRETLGEAKRIVVKLGTSTLTHATGKLNFWRIEKLIRSISDLQNQGRQMILVTSGAVGAGMEKLGLTEKPRTIPEKQAAAAVGQGVLMQVYEKIFSEYGQTVAQVLLTSEVSVVRSRYANSRNTLLTLLDKGVIPIINENDAVAIDELKIGDNDRLSAMVASIVEADLLIILSDVDGVYTDNPMKNPKAKLISEIADITPEIEALSGETGSKTGTGGMATKIQAAKIAVSSGVAMVIANSAREEIIRHILTGTFKGTFFSSRENRLQIRKRWLAFGARLCGSITVDEGCAEALLADGSSLLPTGILLVDGNFEEGNTIQIKTEAGREIARGIANYSSEEIAKIKGCHTQEICECLGYKTYDEVIHRDNLVLLVSSGKMGEDLDEQ